MRFSGGTQVMRPLTGAFAVALGMVLLSTGSPSSLRAQPVSVLDAHVLSRELTAWFEAVSAHRPGAADPAAEQGATLSEDALRDVIRELDTTIRVLQRASSRNRPIPVRGTDADGRLMSSTATRELLGVTREHLATGDLTPAIERAVLLHTDIAVHLYERHPALQGRGAPVGGAGSVMVRDGQPVGTSVRWPHWGVARLLVDRLRRSDELLPGAELWYVAAASYMYAHLNLMDLVPHMREALRLFPASAGVLFHGGLMHALMASPAVQHGAQQAALLPNQKLDVVAARTHLRQARTLLSRSIEADGGQVEARIRFARVLLATDEADEARTHLHLALDALLDAPLEVPHTSALSYYAELFLGDALAARGDGAAAADAYRRAAALFPGAPSPWLALSRLARADGRLEEARELLRRAVDEAGIDEDNADPWWTFYRRYAEDPEHLLEVWRHAVAGRRDYP